jgi:hypothetical protein
VILYRSMAGHTPEDSPLRIEAGPEAEFSASLNSALELARLSPMTGPDFLLSVVDDMQKREVSLTPFRLQTIMRHGFGTREELREKVFNMPAEEFERLYPEGIGAAVEWYLTPPAEKR